MLLLGGVVARLVQLQIVDHELFAEKSQGNRVRIEAVPPIRGLIFDRKGRVIAENEPAYQLELIPEQVDDIVAARLGSEQSAKNNFTAGAGLRLPIGGSSKLGLDYAFLSNAYDLDDTHRVSASLSF